MAKEKNNNLSNLMPIVILAGVGVGGYFIWKKYFKKEEEKEGFIWLRAEFNPASAEVGETITGILVGKNNTQESYLCFIKLVNQETGNLLAPIQSEQVGAGLSKQFTFEFVMPDTLSLRFNVHFGRIIDGKEKIDDTQVYTIKQPEPGYPKEICRDPYCFMVNNQAEEIRMNEFLGIDPPGMDLDSFLLNSTQEQLDYWKDFWVGVWTALHRADLVKFVEDKYIQYAKIVSARIDNFAISVS